ncbi:MAG: hypothetical protein IJF73_00450 [Clostridia bacterium]|nr:hypothetical protein [Clostridia bacterium]
MPLFALLAAENPYNYLNPGGVAFNLSALLIGLLLGGLLAAIATVFYHRAVGRFFSLLQKHGADSPETAKTLAELGIRHALGLRRTLTSRSSLVRKLVSVRLPDGRVIEPIHSLDDDIAAEESEKSAIHAESPRKKRRDAAYVRPGEARLTATAEAGKGEKTDTEAAESAAMGDLAGEKPPIGTPDEVAAPHAPAAEAPASAQAPIPFHPDAAAYFLDDVHRRRAEVRFEKRGNDIRFLVPAILVFVALAATLPVYLPYFAKILDGLLTSLFGGVV